MNKIGWIIVVILFVFVTAFVLSLDNTNVGKRVKISNQNFEITHENTEMVNNESVKINLNDANIKNKNINANNSDLALNSSSLNVENSGTLNNSEVNFNNNSDYSNQSTSYSNSNSNYYNQDINASNSNNISYDNLDDGHLDTMLNNAKNVSTKPMGIDNRPFKQMPRKQQDRYIYKNIDWNTWRSEFVNAILDGSMSVRELDMYNPGTWLYYSFDVYSDGRITNISVKSVYLTEEDKQKVANLIKSYEYSDVTVFPANSKREKAKVSAVMILSDTTERATPSDFNDSEQIKIHLPN